MDFVTLGIAAVGLLGSAAGSISDWWTGADKDISKKKSDVIDRQKRALREQKEYHNKLFEIERKKEEFAFGLQQDQIIAHAGASGIQHVAGDSISMFLRDEQQKFELGRESKRMANAIQMAEYEYKIEAVGTKEEIAKLESDKDWYNMISSRVSIGAGIGGLGYQGWSIYDARQKAAAAAKEEKKLKLSER